MIPTPDRRLRVFVSSTLGELASERTAARTAIETLRLTPVMFEMGARNHAPERVYRDYLSQSDVFVGIYWQSYGWIAPDRAISGLEDEVELARDLPRLVYLKEPAPDREHRLSRLIERIQRSGVATKSIRGADDLAEQLTQDLAVLLSERFSRPDHLLPGGTVTFVFADVEGSTAALERHGAAYSELLGRFRSDAGEVVSGAGGSLIRTEGDGFVAVFPRAQDALDAAVAAQRRHAAYPHPGPLRVRIGLHSGSGIVVDGDYAGIDVHRAARVADAAHGGQILISAPTRELLEPAAGTQLVDLGWFELRGLSRPEHLYRVSVKALADVSSPPRATPSSRSGVPTQLTTMYGREEEVLAVAALLESGVRLLTLTGPGGIGKTRLAVAVADRVQDRYRDGVGFIGLAAVEDPGEVPVTVVAGLGRTIEGSAGGEDVIVEELRDRQFLMILDNVEQVVECAPLLRNLLERLPMLQLLVTSRVALRLSMEREFPVAPVAQPTPDADLPDVVAAPAVQLLLDRARTVRPDLEVTAENAGAISALVRRLDGIPLAIELAAARFRVMEPADVLDRLSWTLDQGTGAVDLPARQRTLRETIDWSYRLLSEPHQVLFARLGIFVDGWTLGAAEAVVGGPEVGDVPTGLDTLAAHSLIQLVPVHGSGFRMRLLGPLRDHARSLLEESGELESLSARHAGHFRVIEHYAEATADGLVEWHRRVHHEWGNILQAVTWFVDHDDHEALATLLASLWVVLWQEDRVDQALQWLEVLRPHISALPAVLRAQVLHIDAFFALEAGDFRRGVDAGRLAIEAGIAIGDETLVAHSRLFVAGSLPAFDVDDPEIPELIHRAVEVFRRSEDVINLAYALNYLGSYHASRREFDTSREVMEQALSLSIGIEALPLEAQSLSGFAFLELLTGDLPAAEEHLARAVQALRTVPNREVTSYVLDGYGWLALLRGDPIRGLTALGAAEGLRTRIGLRVWPLTAVQLTAMHRLADSFDDPDAHAARRAGRQLKPQDALAVFATAPDRAEEPPEDQPVPSRQG